MPHWCDTWPHKIVCSVILKENKIMLWKVGQYPLKDKYNISGLIEEHPEYSYQEKEWTVFNDLGHNKVFNEHSLNWMKQWEVHPKHLGCSPFEQDDINLSEAFGGRFQFVKPLKTGN